MVPVTISSERQTRKRKAGESPTSQPKKSKTPEIPTEDVGYKNDQWVKNRKAELYKLKFKFTSTWKPSEDGYNYGCNENYGTAMHTN